MFAFVPRFEYSDTFTHTKRNVKMKTENISVRLEKADLEALDRMAKEEGRSRSNMMEQLIRREAKKKGAK